MGGGSLGTNMKPGGGSATTLGTLGVAKWGWLSCKGGGQAIPWYPKGWPNPPPIGTGGSLVTPWSQGVVETTSMIKKFSKYL